MLRKVLILSASAGAGHLRAAQAIERAFLGIEAARDIVTTLLSLHDNGAMKKSGEGAVQGSATP